MSAAASLDFNLSSLLAPISAESPAGESLRYEGTYDRIADARREDDPKLAQGVWQRDLKKADWSTVSQICIDALQHRSKDLQIAGWLLESWIHLSGFAGLSAGCHVMVELCRTFWDSMYPELKDPEYRLGPIHWMNEKLVTQLKFIPITHPQGPGDFLPHSMADWEGAFRLEQSKQSAQLKREPKAVTLEIIRQGAFITPAAFFESALEDVSAAYESCNQMEAIFDQAFGRDSSSLGQFRGVLEEILSVISGFQGGREVQAEHESEVSVAQGYALEPVPPGEPMSAQRLPPIRSRSEAYGRLADVADYLMRTEPHSPAPYLIRRAISWGGMTLEELLPELVGDNDATLKNLERLLRLDTVARNNPARKK